MLRRAPMMLTPQEAQTKVVKAIDGGEQMIRLCTEAIDTGIVRRDPEMALKMARGLELVATTIEDDIRPGSAIERRVPSELMRALSACMKNARRLARRLRGEDVRN